LFQGQLEKPITNRADDIYFKLKEFNDAANEFAFSPYSPDLMHRCQMKCSELAGLSDNYLNIKIPKTEKPVADGDKKAKTENEKLQEHIVKLKTFIGLKYENLKVGKGIDQVAEAQQEALRLYSEHDRLLLFSGILK